MADTKANVQTIIGNLQADNPAIKVFLGSVLPSSRGFANQTILQALNIEYQEIAESNSNVAYVDLWTGVSGSVHLYDGIHPNLVGEQLVASRFYNAMMIPEPASLVMLAYGGLVLLGRRKNLYRNSHR